MPPELEGGRIPVLPRVGVQTSGSEYQIRGLLFSSVVDRGCAVSGLPLEVFLEIFSYLSDHRRFIRANLNGRRMCKFKFIGKEHAEGSIVIRRLTMTCRQLRNLLIPLLWTDVEACIQHACYNPDTGSGSVSSNLYAKCRYLSLNEGIAAHVRFVRLFTPWFTTAQDRRPCRIFSVILWFRGAPDDLMEKFVDCLIQLPNLDTLKILDASSRAPISNELSRVDAVFPRIRALRITSACHLFIRNCPNLEDLTFTNLLTPEACDTIAVNGQTLKRVAGVDLWNVNGELVDSIEHEQLLRNTTAVCLGCPDLREIRIVGEISVSVPTDAGR